MVWPFGCVCHAVRALGVKWTLLALRREPFDGAATASMKTAPVNQSLGPSAVSIPCLVICMADLLVVLSVILQPDHRVPEITRRCVQQSCTAPATFESRPSQTPD